MRLAPVLAVLLAVTVACGEDEPTQYSGNTRTNLMVTCEAEGDLPMVGDVCACTYRSIRTRLPFARFRQVDQELRNDPEAPLPDDVLELLAECVVEVGDL